jgi:hypothetical protein
MVLRDPGAERTAPGAEAVFWPVPGAGQKNNAARPDGVVFLEVTPGFEVRYFRTILCYNVTFSHILQLFKNFLCHIKPALLCPFYADKGKNKGNCLLPLSGNCAKQCGYALEVIDTFRGYKDCHPGIISSTPLSSTRRISDELFLLQRRFRRESSALISLQKRHLGAIQDGVFVLIEAAIPLSLAISAHLARAAARATSFAN